MHVYITTYKYIFTLLVGSYDSCYDPQVTIFQTCADS